VERSASCGETTIGLAKSEAGKRSYRAPFGSFPDAAWVGAVRVCYAKTIGMRQATWSPVRPKQGNGWPTEGRSPFQASEGWRRQRRSGSPFVAEARRSRESGI